jgi:hypothetical protein
MRRRRALLLAAAALTGAAGCGGGAAPAPEPAPALAAEERRAVAAYDARISAHCVRVSRALVDPRQGPTPEQARDAFAAADALAALAARKPDAELDVNQDLRLFLGDVLENLEGSNCDPRMRARLAEALRAIPAE